MTFWDKLFSSPEVSNTEQEAEQAVIITFLISDEFPNKDEIKIIRTLEDKVESLVTEQNIGDYDGDGCGDGECSLFFYGKEAEKILEAIKPELEKFSIKPIKVYLRFGAVDDDKAEEKTVVIN